MRFFVIILILLKFNSGICQFADVTEQKNFIPAHSAERYGSGVSAIDYDQDGDLDFYITTERGYPDYLYQNNQGSFTSIAESVGLTSKERSRMTLWFDIDNDKDLDLLVVGDCNLDGEDCSEDSDSNMRLYRQENGQFIEITFESGLIPYGPKERKQVLGGLVAGDINHDGHLDFIQTVNNGTIEAFINDGNGVFEELSDSLGLNFDIHYYWQPFLHDFNNDGLLDFYCNVDFGENQFFLNSTSGRFSEVGKTTKSNNSFNEMGISLGDIDNDGDFDIYSTNSENYLGEDVHNIMLQQNQDEASNLIFEEVSKKLQVNSGGWGWGTTFFDYNNDGLIDLASTNGWEEKGPDQSKIWIQQPDQSFKDESNKLGFDDILSASSLISMDYDRDGDLDMIQSLKDIKTDIPPFRLLENQISQNEVGNYLVIKPRMNGLNHFSIGATVTAFLDGKIYKRIIHAGTSYYGQEPAEAFIGLGEKSKVDSLNITWPGGEVSWWYNIDVNQILDLDDSKVLHRPTNLKATVLLERDPQLTWNDMSQSESGYLLQRSTDMNFSSVVAFNLPANTTSYLDSNVELSPVYYYRIKAYNEIDSSRYSTSVKVEYIILSTDNGVSKHLDIFPNPANSIVNIKSQLEINSLELFSLSGQVIFQSKNKYASGELIQIDITNKEKGIYILRINSTFRKIILE